VDEEGTLIGLCMQDYKSLCAAVAICSTVVNMKTDPHTNEKMKITNSHTRIISIG